MSVNVERVIGHELSHLRSRWWWLLLLGVLLVACGTAAIVFPYVTVLTSVAIVTVIGAMLLVAGAATIVGAFWAGRWSGLLLQLLVGILYTVSGMVIINNPVVGTLTFTVFIAASFIVLGTFRLVAALVLQFSAMGLGRAQRRGDAAGRHHHFSPSAGRCPVGHRPADRFGNVVQWLDVDHALAGLARMPADANQPAHVG